MSKSLKQVAVFVLCYNVKEYKLLFLFVRFASFPCVSVDFMGNLCFSAFEWCFYCVALQFWGDFYCLLGVGARGGFFLCVVALVFFIYMEMHNGKVL